MRKEYVFIPVLWMITAIAFGWLLSGIVKPPQWDYYAVDPYVVGAIVLSQLVRSFREAIDHNKGSRKLGIVWHYLYYVQAGALLFAGMLTPYAFPYIVKGYVLAVLGGVLSGWVVHKIGLYYFRKLPFEQDWW